MGTGRANIKSSASPNRTVTNWLHHALVAQRQLRLAYTEVFTTGSSPVKRTNLCLMKTEKVEEASVNTADSGRTMSLTTRDMNVLNARVGIVGSHKINVNVVRNSAKNVAKRLGKCVYVQRPER